MKSKSSSPQFIICKQGEKTNLKIVIKGCWTSLNLRYLSKPVLERKTNLYKTCTVHMKELENMDTAGAWALKGILTTLSTHYDIPVNLIKFQEPDLPFKSLLDYIDSYGFPKPWHSVSPAWWQGFLENLGRGFSKKCQLAKNMLDFFYVIFCSFIKLIYHPSNVRLTSLTVHIEQTGFKALPVVGLISFLIGIVLTFQGAFQMKRFGAEIFTVDLLSISVFREIGVLLTAIVVAGRSGSAYAAQIGTMKLNQELDALVTFGLDPIKILVLPRIIALMITLPLLTFFANMMALLGGGIMSKPLLGLSYLQFLNQFQYAMTYWTFWMGLIKAPFFAFLIGLVGCFEGLKVTGGAESVGRSTTQAVVESIFLVIVGDAILSIFFSSLGF